MNVAFILIAFNSDHVLEPCLRSVFPFGKVYAAEGPVKFWQKRGYSTSTDKTSQILDDYIPTVHGQWPEKCEEANAAMALVPDDTDFVFCLDADEIWDEMALRSIFKILEAGKTDSVSFKAISFYGGFERYMTGFEAEFEVHRIQRYYPGARFTTHRPPTILAPDGKPWRDHRHVLVNHLRFFHYSYVFPSQMEAKAAYYAEMGGNITNYFERVYLPWVCGNDIARRVIEDEFDGVHNWLPKRRGPCRTALFEGQHPKEIQEAMPMLRRRFEMEIAGL